MDTSEAYIKMCYAAFPEDVKDGNCLKTQDQLQEMVNDGTDAWTRAMAFGYALGGTQAEIYWDFTSMEQLWLAFVMKEKYNKMWSGSEWVIKEKV